MQFKRPVIRKTLASSYSGYNENTRRYGNSGFWLNSDSFSDHSVEQFRGSKVDTIRLAGYLKAVKNFVRIVTNSDDIAVEYSTKDNSYTNGKKVVLSSKIDDTGFDSTVGLALHEGSHCLLTDFNLCTSVLDHDGKPRHNSGIDPNVFQWGEAIEAALNMGTWDTSGTQYSSGSPFMKAVYSNLKWIKDILNIVEDRRIDNYIYTNAPGYRGYYEALYDRYFRNKHIDNVLAAGTYSDNTMDCYMFHICNFANPNRKLDTLPGLREIWNKLDLKNIGRLTSTADSLRLADEIYVLICKHLAEAPEEEQQGKGRGGDQGGESQPGEGGDSGADVNEDDNTTGSGPGLGEDSGNQQGTNKSESLSPAQLRDLEKAKELFRDNQRNFIDGKVKKSNLSKKDNDIVSVAAESNINYQSVGGNVFDDEGREWSLKKLNAIVLHGWDDKVVSAGFVDSFIHSGYKVWYAQKNKPLDEMGYYARYFAKEHEDVNNPVTLGIQLGTLLGKRLKTRDEERSLKTTRLDSGKIDKRLVAELGYGNSNVFAQVLHSVVTPSIVHISIDASGSMNGDKWDSAMKTAIAIAKAGTMISTLDVIISLRGTFDSHTGSASPMMWVVYDSRKQKFSAMIDRFKALRPNGSTPEGLCFEAIMKEVLKDANGKKAYMVNISDGEPAFSSADSYYHGYNAYYHTRKQVTTMQNAGIEVLSYFVEDSYTNEGTRSNFQLMYPKAASFIKCDNLAALSKTLNAMFERGVE
jgi:hypothetical protein